MKKLISILQVYALIAVMYSPALAGTATRVKADVYEGGDNAIPNPGAEGPAPLPVAFANPAGTAPTTMTGGSPGTTCTRVAGMDGMAFKMDLGSGSSRQGEGCAFAAVAIPKSMRGKTVAFAFPFEVTGSLVEDDLKIYAYDNTNGELITPTWHQKIIGLQGDALATFPTKTNTASLSVGVFVARTATTALSLLIDNVKLSKSIPAMGMAGSDTAIDTSWTYDNAGTVTANSVSVSYRGDKLVANGGFTTGTPAPSVFAINLPAGKSLDTAKLGTAARIVGRLMPAYSASQNLPASGVGPWLVFYDGSTNNKLFVASNTASSAFTKANGSTLFLSSMPVTFDLEVPISGLSSNVTMGQSSVVKMSSILANGVRVSGRAPDKLGEYRARSKTTANSNTFADAAPTTLPSASDGMKLDPAVYTGAQTSGLISLWDIYIGPRKNWKLNVSSSTGFSGAVNTTYFPNSSFNTVFGVKTYYNEATGVLTIDAGLNDFNTVAFRSLGTDASGNGVSNGYFDITVSENALAVGMDLSKFPKIYTATITNNGTACAVTNQMYNSDPATWVSATRSTTGVCPLTFTPSFSGTPLCLCSRGDTVDGVCNVDSVTASGGTNRSYKISSPGYSDGVSNISCMVPR